MEGRLLVERKEYERLVVFREKAEKFVLREQELQLRQEQLEQETRELRGQLETQRRLVEVARSDKVEVAAKLELANQKVAGLERENMKLFRLNVDSQEEK